MAKDLIDQCPSSSLRSKKIRADEEGLEDRFEDLGDIWIELRGYELFIYGSNRRVSPQPFNNLWRLNLGRLVVANVFMNVELMKALANNYDPKTRTIYNYMCEPILAITKEVIDTVFELDWGFEELIHLKKLTSEYFNLEHIYKM